MTPGGAAPALTVIDASVAVKWVVPEAGTDAAVALLDGQGQFLAPAIIRIEVAAAVLRLLREAVLSDPEARRSLDLWDSLLAQRAVRLVPNDELFKSAVELSFRARHALPDCLYFAAADMHSASIITADRAMAERGRKINLTISLLTGSKSSGTR